MYQCVGNLISIMLRIVYLAEPPYGIICLRVRVTNRWYVRNHFIPNVLKKDKAIQFQHKHSNLLPEQPVTSFPAGRGNHSYLLPREKFKLPYLSNQAH